MKDLNRVVSSAPTQAVRTEEVEEPFYLWQYNLVIGDGRQSPFRALFMFRYKKPDGSWDDTRAAINVALQDNPDAPFGHMRREASTLVEKMLGANTDEEGQDALDFAIAYLKELKRLP
jgi:hypothetical protein